MEGAVAIEVVVDGRSDMFDFLRLFSRASRTLSRKEGSSAISDPFSSGAYLIARWCLRL